MLNSPCDGKCKLDFQTKLCMGCFRTMNEILGWVNFSEDQRQKINKLAEKRKISLNSNSEK